MNQYNANGIIADADNDIATGNKSGHSIDIESIPGTVVLANADGNIRAVNQRFLQATGFSGGETVDVPMTSFWKGPLDDILEIIRQRDANVSWQGVITHARKDGSEYQEFCVISKIPADRTHGRRVLKIGYPLDGASKTTDACLLETQKYQNIFDAMQEVFFEVDLNGKFIKINDYGIEFYGRSREELLQLSYRDYIPAEQVHIVSKALAQVKKTGIPSSVLRVDINHKDGTRVATQSVFALKKDDAGEPVGFLGIQRDVTLREKIKNDLMEREESYRKILNALPLSIIISQMADTTHVLVNDTLCRRTGYRRDEIIGKTTRELSFFKNKADEERFEETLLRDRQVDRMETEIQSKDGRILETLISSRRIRYKGRTCVLTISADISELKATQRALRESDESHRTILRTTPFSITISRLSDGRYVEVNDAFCTFVGFPKKEIIGRTYRDFHMFSEKADMKRLLKTFLKKGCVDNMEIRVLSKDKTPMVSLASARTIRYKGESCFLYISNNITELKRAQTALEESEESYRTILKTAPYPIVISRLSDGVFVRVNDAFTHRMGYTQEEVLCRSFNDLNLYLNPSDRDCLYEILNRDGYVNNMEVPFITKAGAIVENLISMSKIRFQDEDCVISMTVDINELKKTQNALKESELRFRTIFETAADPIFLNDMQTGTFIDVNQAACRHLGYEKRAFWKMSLNQVQAEPSVSPLSYFSDNKKMYTSLFFESVHVRKDRSKAIVEVNSQSMVHRGRQALLSIARDVTRRKRTEQELARYRENLEQMVAERTEALKKAQGELVKREKLAVLGQLTATVSHELRNPLGVIRSSNFFLQRKIKSNDEKIDKHFKRIDEQIALCDSIVSDLLEYTRGRNVSVCNQDIASWLSEVVEQFQEREDNHISLHLPKDLPLLPHDQEKMRRVIINLLTNAVLAINAKLEKANENSETYQPRITIEAVFIDGCFFIIVTDNGNGMDDETIKKAFEPLFTTRARGTGIGLAIVKKIINEHGGTVHIESQLGEGTRITLKLPGQL